MLKSTWVIDGNVYVTTNMSSVEWKTLMP
jgi:hypothetical protein